MYRRPDYHICWLYFMTFLLLIYLQGIFHISSDWNCYYTMILHFIFYSGIDLRGLFVSERSLIGMLSSSGNSSAHDVTLCKWLPIPGPQWERPSHIQLNAPVLRIRLHIVIQRFDWNEWVVTYIPKRRQTQNVIGNGVSWNEGAPS